MYFISSYVCESFIWNKKDSLNNFIWLCMNSTSSNWLIWKATSWSQNILEDKILHSWFPFLCLRVRTWQGLRGSVSWPCPEGEIETVLSIRNRFITNTYNCAKKSLIVCLNFFLYCYYDGHYHLIAHSWFSLMIHCLEN